MNKKFSDGFMQDLADLLEICVNNGTDSIDLGFEINGQRLNAAIIFSVEEGAEE